MGVPLFIKLPGQIHGEISYHHAKTIDIVPTVADFSDMKLKNYSSGMRARLGFSTALQVNPDILLVDEVLSVGDIRFRKKSSEEFLSFKKKGKTILYTTHNLSIVSELSDRILLIDKGKLIMIGKPEETIQRYKEIIRNKKN